MKYYINSSNYSSHFLSKTRNIWKIQPRKGVVGDFIGGGQLALLEQKMNGSLLNLCNKWKSLKRNGYFHPKVKIEYLLNLWYYFIENKGSKMRTNLQDKIKTFIALKLQRKRNFLKKSNQYRWNSPVYLFTNENIHDYLIQLDNLKNKFYLCQVKIRLWQQNTMPL